jgi:hypothetical protein
MRPSSKPVSDARHGRDQPRRFRVWLYPPPQPTNQNVDAPVEGFGTASGDRVQQLLTAQNPAGRTKEGRKQGELRSPERYFFTRSITQCPAGKIKREILEPPSLGRCVAADPGVLAHIAGRFRARTLLREQGFPWLRIHF